MKISSHGPPFHNGLLHDHTHLSSAAAMYLGVGQKFLMEQEARMAKEAAMAAAVSEAQHHHHHQHHSHPQKENISERLNMIKNHMTPSNADLEGLADALKSEITASLTNLIDSIVTR